MKLSRASAPASAPRGGRKQLPGAVRALILYLRCTVSGVEQARAARHATGWDSFIGLAWAFAPARPSVLHFTEGRPHSWIQVPSLAYNQALP